MHRLGLSQLFFQGAHVFSWLQSPSAVILEPKKIKSVTSSTFSPSICHEVIGPDAMVLALWMLSFKPAFSLSSFTLIKRLFSSPSLYAIRVVSSEYLRLLIDTSPSNLDSSLCFIQPIILHDILCIEFCQENALVIANILLSNTREDSTYGHHQMVNTEIRLIIFFAGKDGEALYSQQK